MPSNLTFALISDTGGPIASSTTFYYNTTDNNFVPTNSLGPGPKTVSQLVQSWKPSEIFAVGDLAYNAGASTINDAAIGQYYNNFIYPYPSEIYLKEPYTSINGAKAEKGLLKWPYNVYNYPLGFPNPNEQNKNGGSTDKTNHFWSALGNHDYGLAIGYAQVGATSYDIKGNLIGDPTGPSSAPSVESFIDYFLPFLENSAILGANQVRLNIGSSDKSGNNGAYYSMSFGGTKEVPQVQVFLLDTERLGINAGMENWNPSGQKILVDGKYQDQIKKDANFSLNYNPASPNSSAFSGTTNNLANGYKQFEWLTNALSSSKAKWKIVTGHHPVYASGRWGDENPDDHMSNSYLQKYLKALPAGSFDAYYNGHDHFYERVLETNSNGIGLGIPFITNGNNGRNLEAKMQIPYGSSIYNPPPGGSGKPDPNKEALPYLLKSEPILVGSSGLSGTPKEDTSKYKNGLYGYGFGAVKVDIDTDYLLFDYQEAPLIDPAISNHLTNGINPEEGFADTTSKDWTPNPNGSYNAAIDLATFKLSITDGKITKVELINKGQGYMSSKGGNNTITGFNIYGNNVDMQKPWLGTAQVDLTFAAGMLEKVNLTDSGSAYELAVKSTAENNNATTTDGLESKRDLIVAINYNLDEIQYKVRDNSLYNDWYLIADTAIQATAKSTGQFGSLAIKVQPSSEKARNIIKTKQITSGYSNTGAQSVYDSPIQGGIGIKDSLGNNIALVSTQPISNGSINLDLITQPAPGKVQVSFTGDPKSSYLVNYKPANIELDLIYESWNAGMKADNINTISFTQNLSINLVRTDTLTGNVTVGLRSVNNKEKIVTLLLDSTPAALSALNINQIFAPSGNSSWWESEGKYQGTAGTQKQAINAGDWIPFAIDSNGKELQPNNVKVSSNTAIIGFNGGYQINLGTTSSGIFNQTAGKGDVLLKVQRLGAFNNGIALYEADSITGAIISTNGSTILPNQPGYLKNALANATTAGLLLNPEQMPLYKGEQSFSNLPINLSKNYGFLLLRDGNPNDLMSSFSTANPGEQVAFMNFAAENRGLVWGVEDLPISKTDNDYNDLIISMSSNSFRVI